MEHSSEGEEWMCEWRMDINATRLMYNHICYAIETWPGSPRRPTEEQIYLHDMKTKLFAMLTDYNFHYGSIE